MGKVNITVEMNDEEYERYKRMESNDFIPKDTTITDFLEMKGFTQVKTDIGKDVESLGEYAIVLYSKGKDTITICAKK